MSFLGGHRSASSSIGSLNSSFNDGVSDSGTSTPKSRSRVRSRSNSLSGTRKPNRKVQNSTDYKLEEGMTVLFNNDMGKHTKQLCWLHCIPLHSPHSISITIVIANSFCPFECLPTYQCILFVSSCRTIYWWCRVCGWLLARPGTKVMCRQE